MHATRGWGIFIKEVQENLRILALFSSLFEHLKASILCEQIRGSQKENFRFKTSNLPNEGHFALKTPS